MLDLRPGEFSHEVVVGEILGVEVQSAFCIALCSLQGVGLIMHVVVAARGLVNIVTGEEERSKRQRDIWPSSFDPNYNNDVVEISARRWFF